MKDFELLEKLLMENVQNLLFLLKNHCKEKIEPIDIIYYSGYPYNKYCVRCLKCQKIFNDQNSIDDFICVTTGLFVVDFDKLQKLIGDNIKIIMVESGSTFFNTK